MTSLWPAECGLFYFHVGPFLGLTQAHVWVHYSFNGSQIQAGIRGTGFRSGVQKMPSTCAEQLGRIEATQSAVEASNTLKDGRGSDGVATIGAT